MSTPFAAICKAASPVAVIGPELQIRAGSQPRSLEGFQPFNGRSPVAHFRYDFCMNCVPRMSHEPNETIANHHYHGVEQVPSRPVSRMEVEEGLETDSDSDNDSRQSTDPTTGLADWLLATFDTWLHEVIATVFSLACFASIVGVLVAYDQEPTPSLSYGLTLNAIISILATASKSSLVFTIGECIGQLKWVWFHKSPRQVDGMQLFDSASRGPLGSLMVIFKHRGQSLVSLGAIVIILALAFEPFLQQILTYPIRTTADVSTPIAATAKQVPYILPTQLDTPASIVYKAQWSDREGDIEPPACPTGNCTWSPFESIGLCHKCEDITALTTVQCKPVSLNTSKLYLDEDQSCFVSPPKGYGYDIIVTYSSTTSNGIPILDKRDGNELWFEAMYPHHAVWSPFSLDGPGPGLTFNNYTYAGVANPQLVMVHAEFSLPANYSLRSTAKLDVGPDLKVTKATQCALTVCLQEYEISVSNGAVSSNTTAVDFGEILSVDIANGSVYANFPEEKAKDSDPDRLGRMGLTRFWKPTNRPGTDITLTNTSSIWLNASEFAFEPPGLTVLSSYIGGDSASRLLITQNSSHQDRAYEETDPAILKTIENGLEHTMGKIASSLTRSAMKHSNTQVNGTMSSAKVYVSVNWAWIILPAALQALGVAFLVLTIFTNRRRRLQLWKTSLLAVLFHGLDGWRSVDDRHATVSQMEWDAQGLEVELKAAGDGKDLMLRGVES